MKYKSNKDIIFDIKQDYSKAIIFNSNDFPNKGHLFQVVKIPPKTKQRKHYHLKQTELFYIVEGKCSIYINDIEYIALPGDSFLCEPNDTHYLHNKEDIEFKLVVFKLNKDENDDDTIWED